MRLSYAPVVQRAAPAVVNVYAAKTVANRNPLFEDPIFRRFFGMPGGARAERAGAALARLRRAGRCRRASWSPTTTSSRAPTRSRSRSPTSASSRPRSCSRIRAPTWRCCASRTQSERFPALDFADSDALQVGDLVLAIGNPFGVGQTVTHGIVSAVARTQVGITDYQFFIQTDAAINPGNSGGALVDLTGKLVGINTAIFSRSGGSQGIGFAIPANMVRVVVASAQGGGSVVKRPWLGARLQAVTPEIAESLGLKRPTGALVATVTRRKPGGARRACETGDLIVAVDGQAVDDPNAFDYRFATKALGGTAQLGILRGGREMTCRSRSRRRPNAARRDLIIDAARRSRAPRSPTCRRRWPMNCGSTRPPKASSIARCRPMARRRRASASSKGDLVLSVNNQKIAKTRDLDRGDRRSRAGSGASPSVRGGQQMSVELRG